MESDDEERVAERENAEESVAETGDTQDVETKERVEDQEEELEREMDELRANSEREIKRETQVFEDKEVEQGVGVTMDTTGKTEKQMDDDCERNSTSRDAVREEPQVETETETERETERETGRETTGAAAETVCDTHAELPEDELSLNQLVLSPTDISPTQPTDTFPQASTQTLTEMTAQPLAENQTEYNDKVLTEDVPVAVDTHTNVFSDAYEDTHIEDNTETHNVETTTQAHTESHTEANENTREDDVAERVQDKESETDAEWVLYYSTEGYPYYYNAALGLSQWAKLDAEGNSLPRDAGVYESGTSSEANQYNNSYDTDYPYIGERDGGYHGPQIEESHYEYTYEDYAVGERYQDEDEWSGEEQDHGDGVDEEEGLEREEESEYSDEYSDDESHEDSGEEESSGTAGDLPHFDHEMEEKFKAYLRTPEGVEAVLAEQDRIARYAEKREIKERRRQEREYARRARVTKKRDDDDDPAASKTQTQSVVSALLGGFNWIAGTDDDRYSQVRVRPDKASTARTHTSNTVHARHTPQRRAQWGSDEDVEQRGSAKKERRHVASSSSHESSSLSSDLDSISSDDSDVEVINAPMVPELNGWLNINSLYDSALARISRDMASSFTANSLVIGERALSSARDVAYNAAIATGHALYPLLLHFLRTVVDGETTPAIAAETQQDPAVSQSSQAQAKKTTHKVKVWREDAQGHVLDVQEVEVGLSAGRECGVVESSPAVREEDESTV